MAQRRIQTLVSFLLTALVTDQIDAFFWNLHLRQSASGIPIHSSSTPISDVSGEGSVKDRLLHLISSTPANAPTSNKGTDEILGVVHELESECPTQDIDVITELAGNWELLWTAQDQSSDEWGKGPIRRFINPLENQAYSNNPSGSGSMGRANPVLPRPVQDRLETIGFIEKDATPVKSTQAIDTKENQVRNVVTFTVPSFGGSRKATLTVTVDFSPNDLDKRTIDVKFRACRVFINKSPFDFNIPLGIIGPTGWLRTTYIDETMRITRGNKGSIFVLTRTSKKSQQA